MFEKGQFIIITDNTPKSKLVLFIKSKNLKITECKNYPNNLDSIQEPKQEILELLEQSNNTTHSLSTELREKFIHLNNMEIKLNNNDNFEKKDIKLFAQGQITLIASCMFASKSRILIDNFAEKQDQVDAFMPIVNTREDVIKSRTYGNDKTISCTKIKDPEEMLKSTKPIVIIDEFHFFNQTESLKSTILELKQQGKAVVIAGLDLLASGEEWPAYTVIKEISDVEIKPKARCQNCGKPASFTSLVKGQKNKSVQVESEQTVYEPRCKEHFTR